MRVEGSSISCGVRRLIIDSNDEASAKKLQDLIRNQSCAMLVTSVPTRRKDMMALLADNGFERIKKPAKFVADPSIKSSFAEMAFEVMYHDHEIDDDGFEKFVDETIKADMTDMATSILHHGDYVGSLNFYVRCMKNN